MSQSLSVPHQSPNFISKCECILTNGRHIQGSGCMFAKESERMEKFVSLYREISNTQILEHQKLEKVMKRDERKRFINRKIKFTKSK